MNTNSLPHLARLTRLDSSLFIFSVVFVPLIARGNDFLESLVFALPLLTTSMCAFALNDINDIERDRTNHPSRPLATGILSIRFAMGVYLFLLIATLIWLRVFLDFSLVWPYVLYLIILINYNYVIDEFPVFKNIAVSIAIVMPVIILDNLIRDRISHLSVITAVFLFILGREVLMDVRDTQGDGETLPKKFGKKRSAIGAFILQLIAVSVLWYSTQDTRDIAINVFVTSILAITCWIWFQTNNEKLSVQIMKIQLIAGIGYLI